MPVVAVPLVTPERIILLVLVDTNGLALGLEIIHAVVVDRSTLILVREGTAVAARTAGNGAAALEVLINLAASNDHLVFLGCDEDALLQGGHRYK